MAELRMRTMNGGMAVLAEPLVESLATDLSGGLVTPTSETYDETRAIWNAMIDRRPGLIIRCADSEDVVRAVKFGRENGLLVSVRGAGHNIAGNAVADDALMVDLSGMKLVEVEFICTK